MSFLDGKLQDDVSARAADADALAGMTGGDGGVESVVADGRVYTEGAEAVDGTERAALDALEEVQRAPVKQRRRLRRRHAPKRDEQLGVTEVPKRGLRGRLKRPRVGAALRAPPKPGFGEAEAEALLSGEGVWRNPALQKHLRPKKVFNVEEPTKKVIVKYGHGEEGRYLVDRVVDMNVNPTDGQEAEIMEWLKGLSKQPGLVDIHGAFVERGAGCFGVKAGLHVVFEPMMGGSAVDLCRRAKGPLSERTLWALAHNALVILKDLQEAGVIHRDIEPRRMKFTGEGELKFDLGDLDTQALIYPMMAARAMLPITKTYMAPERIKGERYSSKADIWSLGISLMEMATGRHPLQDAGDIHYGNLLRAAVAGEVTPLPEGKFSAEFCRLIARMVDKNPDTRADAATLLASPLFAGRSIDESRRALASRVVRPHRECKPQAAPPALQCLAAQTAVDEGLDWDGEGAWVPSAMKVFLDCHDVKGK